MKVLGLESSCDETAAALVADGHRVLGAAVASQVENHAPYGGVIPELAAREHLRALRPVVEETLAAAGAELADVEGVAVTASPGLLPALLVGIGYAKGLAAALDVPLLGVNHILAHIFGAFVERADWLADPARYPLVALVVSGGHSSLFRITVDGRVTVLGQTIDDAAGEAYDKAAKLLDLGYPGGPVIDRLAARGNPRRYAFPRGLLPSGGAAVNPEHRLNFSFSGLKTALLYHLRDLAPAGDLHAIPESDLLDSIASFQEAAVDALVTKAMMALDDPGGRTLALCGGVACNRRLRAAIQTAADERGVALAIAPPKYCTDNAVMIAGLADYYLRHGIADGLDLDASPRFINDRDLPFAPHWRPR